MITKDNMVYILKRTELKNITEHQLEEFISEFDLDDKGNVLIPYQHKGYTCNDKMDLFINSDIQAISFFSGCGGLDIGTQLAGVKVLSSLDFYEDSVNSLRKNPFFSHSEHFFENINNVNGKDYINIIKKNNPSKLLIVGGPPCQPFSKAGYWVKNENRKANDDPRNMIEPYFRLISEIMPDGFVLENVESILHPSNRPAVDVIVNNMEKLGYNFSMLKTNAADYGIPQKRKRVFFIATKKKIKASIVQTHGDDKAIKNNPKLLPYEKGLNNAEWLGFWKQYLAIAISFVGLCVAYVSSNTDRKHKRQEEQAQQYLEGVRQEENVLVDVTQGFNISIVYKALLQQSKSANIYDGRMVLTNARANMDQMHIKFEILTELCDDFKKCENCRYLPCIDRKVMIELRDLFYDIEKHYFNMLDIGESFLECLDKEQERKKLLETETKIQNNTEELIELYKNQGLTDNVYLSQQDLQSIKKQIKNLEKSKLRLEEMNKAISEIQKEIDYINKDARPKFIRYCKIYIDMKKEHARELRKTGNIQYNKMNEKL